MSEDKTPNLVIVVANGVVEEIHSDTTVNVKIVDTDAGEFTGYVYQGVPAQVTDCEVIGDLAQFTEVLADVREQLIEEFQGLFESGSGTQH